MGTVCLAGVRHLVLQGHNCWAARHDAGWRGAAAEEEKAAAGRLARV